MHMDLYTYSRKYHVSGIRELARLAGCSENYLIQLYSKLKTRPKKPSPQLCKKLVEVDPEKKLTLSGLRPDIWN